MTADTITVCQFYRATDRHPKPLTITFAGLCAVATRHRITDVKDGPSWSPAAYLPKTTRGKANVMAVTVAVVDLDHVPAMRDRATFEREMLPLIAGRRYFVYTTFSHTLDDPRGRVGLQLTEPVPAAEWPDVGARIRHYIFDDLADPGCKDASRMYLWAEAKPGAPRWSAFSLDGEPLDWRSLPEFSRPKVEPRPLTGSAPSTRYAEAALRRECEEVAASRNHRNDRLNVAAYNLGELIAAGALGRSAVEIELERAAIACGLDADVNCDLNGIRGTIASGIAAGMQKPRLVPERPRVLPSLTRPTGVALPPLSRPAGRPLPPLVRPEAVRLSELVR